MLWMTSNREIRPRYRVYDTRTMFCLCLTIQEKARKLQTETVDDGFQVVMNISRKFPAILTFRKIYYPNLKPFLVICFILLLSEARNYSITCYWCHAIKKVKEFNSSWKQNLRYQEDFRVQYSPLLLAVILDTLSLSHFRTTKVQNVKMRK